ncbi:hypothetical protein F183_A25600 [Bryobacterales bacterium F-183]|nr:hypothetical protein F183_A25600 [Bryobacterales bacterium F-183]
MLSLRLAVAAAILILALASRLSHKDVVWIEEAYPAAAAIQMSDYGLAIYQDFWFDKPPGAVYFYRLFGAQTGVPLRLMGALFVCLSALLAFLAARRIWDDEVAALWAAAFVALFLAFDHPAAVMAIAPDLLMVPVQLLALYLAASRRYVWAGVACGVAFWINPKAVFAALALVVWSRSWVLAVSAAVAALAMVAPYWSQGFYEQVIVWGRMYSADPPEGINGWKQTAAWVWFHAALVVGAIVAREPRWLVPIAINAVAVVLGLRFFPRYYFQLLPLVAVVAARGVSLSKSWVRYVIVALLLIPVVRFGRVSPPANQLALYEDSVAAAAKLTDRQATLFVWGYRPDLLILTRMKLGAPYLDSQPVNGVLADRHLVSSKPSTEGRRSVIAADYVADGLGLLNPALAFRQDGYEEFARTKFTVLYRRVK